MSQTITEVMLKGAVEPRIDAIEDIAPNFEEYQYYDEVDAVTIRLSEDAYITFFNTGVVVSASPSETACLDNVRTVLDKIGKDDRSVQFDSRQITITEDFDYTL